MRQQIKHISVVQTSKVIAILYVLIALIYSFIIALIVAFSPAKMEAMRMMYILFMPILMGILSFLMMLFFCWLYNVVANWVGGIEFTVEEVE